MCVNTSLGLILLLFHVQRKVTPINSNMDPLPASPPYVLHAAVSQGLGWNLFQIKELLMIFPLYILLLCTESKFYMSVSVCSLRVG